MNIFGWWNEPLFLMEKFAFYIRMIRITNTVLKRIMLVNLGLSVFSKYERNRFNGNLIFWENIFYIFLPPISASLRCICPIMPENILMLLS